MSKVIFFHIVICFGQHGRTADKFRYAGHVQGVDITLLYQAQTSLSIKKELIVQESGYSAAFISSYSLAFLQLLMVKSWYDGI